MDSNTDAYLDPVLEEDLHGGGGLPGPEKDQNSLSFELGWLVTFSKSFAKFYFYALTQVSY